MPGACEQGSVFLRGVSSVQVDLLGNSMTVEASDDLPWERIVSAVEKAGYKAFFKGGEAVLDEGIPLPRRRPAP